MANEKLSELKFLHNFCSCLFKPGTIQGVLYSKLVMSKPLEMWQTLLYLLLVSFMNHDSRVCFTILCSCSVSLSPHIGSYLEVLWNICIRQTYNLSFPNFILSSRKCILAFVSQSQL